MRETLHLYKILYACYLQMNICNAWTAIVVINKWQYESFERIRIEDMKEMIKWDMINVLILEQ
jgi:hypothetical protein